MNKGFTLVELLVVITIICCMLLTIIISFPTMLQAQEVATATRILEQYTQAAKVSALQKRTVIGFSINLGPEQYAISNSGYQSTTLNRFIDIQCKNEDAGFFDYVTVLSLRLTFDKLSQIKSLTFNDSETVKPIKPIDFRIHSIRDGNETEMYLRFWPLTGVVDRL